LVVRVRVELVIDREVELELDLALAEVALQEAELVIGLAAAQALEIAPVVAELVIGPVVAPELVIGPVEAELELAQEEAELELAQEVLVPARGHPRAQLAVALRIKSVTGARRRDLVLRLAAEDLVAAAAETTREPAAAEAVIAWEVAE
jgi:hypothetical protein